MELKSSAFADGATIPRRFTGEGEDVSPPLQWSGVPAEACGLVLLCDDLDAPSGVWRHWAVYDLPVERSSLSEGAGRLRGMAGRLL